VGGEPLRVRGQRPAGFVDPYGEAAALASGTALGLLALLAAAARAGFVVAMAAAMIVLREAINLLIAQFQNVSRATRAHRSKDRHRMARPARTVIRLLRRKAPLHPNLATCRRRFSDK